MIDLVTAIRSVRAEMNITASTPIPLVLAGASAETKARAERWSEFVQRLARVADISFADTPPQGSVQLLMRGEVAALAAQGRDRPRCRARAAREGNGQGRCRHRARRRQARQCRIRRATRAEEVVEGEREKREEAEDRRRKILRRWSGSKARRDTRCAALRHAALMCASASRGRGGAHVE